MNLLTKTKRYIPIAVFLIALIAALLYIYSRSNNFNSWVSYSVNEDKGLIYGLGNKQVINFVNGEFAVQKTFFAQSDVVEIPYSLLKKTALGDQDKTEAKYITVDIKYKTTNPSINLSAEDSRGNIVQYNIYDQVLLDLINSQSWHYKTVNYSNDNKSTMSLLTKDIPNFTHDNFFEMIHELNEVSTRDTTTISTINWFYPQLPFTYDLKKTDFVYNGRARGPVVLEGRSSEDVLRISFTKKDLNLYEGEDTARIILTDAESNQIVYETDISDDGNTKGSNAFSPGTEKPISIAIPNMKNRYFRLESQASVDTLFEKYKINTPYVYFKNYIFLANTPIYGLVTNGTAEEYSALASNIKASVIHNTSEQTLLIDKKQGCDLNAINKEFQCLNKVQTTVHNINVPIPDAIIQTDGYLSPSSQPLVELYPIFTDKRASGTLVHPDTRSILGRFAIPERIKEGEYMSHLVIDISTLDHSNFSIKLIAPDLILHKNNLEIESISIKPL